MKEITFSVERCHEGGGYVARWDAPGGGGKVPISPEYILCRNAGRVLIRNFEGKIFEYPEAADGAPISQPPKDIVQPELCRC